MTPFPIETKKELTYRLAQLQCVCCLPANVIKPTFSFKEIHDDSDWEDVLKWGHGGFQSPSDLKYIWEPKSELKEHDVDFILVNGKKWFFNIYDKIGRFLLQDGTRKVEIEFPYWMEMGKIIKTPGVRTAIFQALGKCMDKKAPDLQALRDYFSDELCHKIYRNNSSREAIEIAVLEIVETLRKRTVEHLRKHYASTIAAEPTFKKFSKTYPNATKLSQDALVLEFLKNHRIPYRLAEKYGLIKNANKLFRYENIRDHQRHPDFITEKKLDPDRIYADFCVALNVKPGTEKITHDAAYFSDNIAVALHLSSLSFIWNILDKHTSPNLKKKEKIAALVKDHILSQEEADLLRDLNTANDKVAHVNDPSDCTREKVASDKSLFDLAYTLSERDRLTHNE